MIVFMYRPSPQIPTPTFDAALRCYEASAFLIKLQKRQVEAQLIDTTWIFTQAIFMALNTVLWCISYSGIRQLHPIEEVNLYVQEAMIAIDLCSSRWPGVRSAQQLYGNLIQSCFKAYESDKIGESPASDYLSSVPPHDLSSTASLAAHSPASTSATSAYGPQSPQSIHSSHGTVTGSTHAFKNSANGYVDHIQRNPIPTITQAPSGQYLSTSSPPPTLAASTLHQSLPGFDALTSAPFMPVTTQGMGPWPGMSAGPVDPGFASSPHFDYNTPPWLATFGDEYSQYMNQTYAPMTNQMQTLSQQEQMELMASLEQCQLPDVSNLISNSTTFYTAQLP